MAAVRSLCRSGGIARSLLTRCISTSSGPIYSASPVAKEKSNVNVTSDGKGHKQILMKLRKDTGFPLAKCKQALVKNDYNFEQALEEMKENAIKEGWSKMSTLSGRETSQGLVAALRSGKCASLLEINCESDFVAKTTDFQSFMGTVTKAMHEHFVDRMTKEVELSSEEILELTVPSKSITVNDALAATIGKLKENIKVSRGIVASVTDEKEFIGVYTHPDLQTPNKGGILPLMGRYAALVKMRTYAPEPQGAVWLQNKARNLAQHIVGMNPSCIGERVVQPVVEKESSESVGKSDEASSNVNPSEEEESQSHVDDDEHDLEEEYFNNEITAMNIVDSDQLLHQSFMLDPNITVQNWLDINRLEVLYFIRYQLGTHGNV